MSGACLYSVMSVDAADLEFLKNELIFKLYKQGKLKEENPRNNEKLMLAESTAYLSGGC